MVNMVPVSPDRHSGQVWRRLSTYSFVAKENYVPIGAAEFGRVTTAFPIGFMELSGQYYPVAILSLVPGRNQFVASDGRWLGGYIPILFRCYPFRLLRQGNTDQFALWVDTDAEQLHDAAASTELFYGPDGKLAPATKQVFDALAHFEQSRIAAMIAAAALSAEGILCPWEIKVREGEQERLVKGLHRIDEVALNKLDDTAFLRLRRANALSIAYAQLLSMAQLHVFAHLAELLRRVAEVPQKRPPTMEVPAEQSFTMVDPEILRFD
jgi:hypothetical protein